VNMDNFRVAMDITAGHEGGWANNPGDRGGETYRGVSRRFHPAWGGWDKIDAAKDAHGVPHGVNEDAKLKGMAEEFYRREFWEPIHGDELPLPLAVAVFDMAVNWGPSRATRQMQAILGVEVDCIPGPKTIKAAHDAGFNAVLEFISARLVAHHRDAVANPYQEVWINNWFFRCVTLAAQVARLQNTGNPGQS
jgi:lysozyme family protein